MIKDRGFAPGHPRLTGPAYLTDAPLTVDDWRIVATAYYGFITVVRRVAQDAWKRQDDERRRATGSGEPTTGEQDASRL